jgi:hypothetical protein
MRPVNSLHNPFSNRFNVPVTQRYDEMQCDEYMAWLRERNLGQLAQQHVSTIIRRPTPFAPMFAGLCGLLVLLLSIAAFVRTL